MDASTRTSASSVDETTLTRYADLLVEVGANVQPGQVVDLRGALDHSELVRAIAESAYRHGAKFVDVNYFDPYVRRARIVHAAPETLDYAPSWQRERALQLGEQRCARISLTPVLPPGLYDDLDPALVAREPFPALPEYLQIVSARTTNWTSAACPTPDWAERVHPDADGADGLAALWDKIVNVCRLDEPDAAAAWRSRFAALKKVAGALGGAQLDSLHFVGRGTDLTIGLFATSTWHGGTGETIDGIEHAPNLPTEEVFTAPDPRRADGVATATRPLVLKGGATVEGLVVRFEAGRVVHADASRGVEALRELLDRDDGARRLGEVALVDGDGRVGRLETVFYSTLLDENAASHVALGNAYPQTVGDAERSRANRSEIHVDFMVGGDGVDVTGITRDGRRIPVLRAGAWQL